MAKHVVVIAVDFGLDIFRKAFWHVNQAYWDCSRSSDDL